MKTIKFEEINGFLYCLNDEINLPSVVCSMSRYRYFYGKRFSYREKSYTFNSVKLTYFEQHRKEIKVYDVNVFVKIKTRKIFEKIKIKSAHEQRFGPQMLFDIYRKEYEKDGVPLIVSNEHTYINKFRKKVMDNFYIAGFDSNSTIINYVKRCVKFGNYKGDKIYADFVFHDNTIQNYLLILKGQKDITAIWQYLDVEISNIEKKKIKYLMNLRHFDDFSEVEKIMCVKLYKRYDKSVYEELIEKCRERNIFTKKAIFDILCKEYDMTLAELLKYSKHKSLYLEYEYTKKQISEALK